MKKVNVILVALVLFIGTLTSYATVNPVVETKTTSEEIAVMLKNPNFLVDVEKNASVSFVVNRNNEIVILSIDTEEESIRHFIKYRLNYKKLETKLEKGKEYIVPIRITSEK